MGLNSFLLPNTSTQFEFTGLVTHRRYLAYDRFSFGITLGTGTVDTFWYVVYDDTIAKLRHSRDFHI